MDFFGFKRSFELWVFEWDDDYQRRKIVALHKYRKIWMRFILSLSEVYSRICKEKLSHLFSNLLLSVLHVYLSPFPPHRIQRRWRYRRRGYRRLACCTGDGGRTRVWRDTASQCPVFSNTKYEMVGGKMYISKGTQPQSRAV